MMAAEAAICGEGTQCQGRRPPNPKEKETTGHTVPRLKIIIKGKAHKTSTRVKCDAAQSDNPRRWQGRESSKRCL
jgi:hypothetical protein